jgi:O-antigen biosynthesis protein
MRKPYSILLPPFNLLSGGIRVMWGLYGWLLAKGEVVVPNARIDGESIAVYPEVINGTPLGGTTVVRYILNTPGVMGYGIPGTSSFRPGPTTFNSTDKLYYFSRLYGKAVNDNHYLFLPIINLNLFKDQFKKRTKTCYFVGKGTNTNVHPRNSIQITREISNDQQGLADLLNECEIMYGYEGHTAMYEVARLCGCRVKIISDYWTKDQFKLYEPGMNGISWGVDEDIPLDSEGFRSHYKLLVREFSAKLNTFIKETQL